MNFHAFRQFDELLRRGFVPKTKEPLRPREVHLLTLLHLRPGMPLHFYAEQVHLERGSFTYLTDNLEIRQLIQRKSDPEDKRRKTIVLTPEGLELVTDLKRQMDQYMDGILASFTPAEQQALLQAHETVRRLIQKLPRPELRHPPHHEH